MKKLPTYRFHKASNQAVCCISGRSYYLGEYGSRESQDKFNRLVAEFLTNPSFGIEKSRQSVAESVVAFLKHAKSYYGSSEFLNFRRALSPLIELYSDLNISEFGIDQFKAVRDYWVKRDAARVYANRQSGRVIAFVKWLVADGVLSPTVHQALKCVAPLKAGRCSCRETDRVLPVAESVIEKTIPHLSPVVADMVRLQSLIGCRPGEICRLKPSMVDTSGSVWIVALDHHKTAWRGHDRRIYIGPKAQAILKPYLDRAKDEFCFSPAESVEQRLQARSLKRITAMSCGNVRGSNRKQAPKRKPGASFTTGSYGRAIDYACKKANLPVWSPNQLRHAAATKLRDIEGIESASLILGHKHLAVTQVYAEKSERKALEIAAKHG
jgi:integrase